MQAPHRLAAPRPSATGPEGRRTASIAGAALVSFLLLVGGTGIAAAPRLGGTDAATAAAAGAAQQHALGTVAPEEAQEVSRQSVHGEPGWVVIARLVNFAILVGVLVYYLRSPIAAYLARRSTEIRSDLTKAAETREAASAELAEVEQKMKSLPAEIEALKARGAEEIAAEEARLRRATEQERDRLLAQARREIDLHLRAAERQLVRQAAELTVGLASDRIKRTINDEDQRRLVDRYLADLQK